MRFKTRIIAICLSLLTVSSMLSPVAYAKEVQVSTVSSGKSAEATEKSKDLSWEAFANMTKFIWVLEPVWVLAERITTFITETSDAMSLKNNIHSIDIDGRELENYPEYLAFVYKNSHYGDPMYFRLRLPAGYDEKVKYPVVVYLHGLYGRGTSNDGYINDSLGQKLLQMEQANPCIIVVPQCSQNTEWQKDETPQQLKELIQLGVIDKYSADKDRIYVTGSSLGALGSWKAATSYPDFYAAAVPLAGSASKEQAYMARHVPIWAAHCADDSVIDVSGSRKMVDLLQNLRGNIRYTEYETGNHGGALELYNNDELYSWLFSQNLQNR